MVSRVAAISATAVVLGVGAGSASAATSTSDFDVTAAVTPAVKVTANALSFGNYDGTRLTATTLINVTATIGTNYTVAISNGLSPTAGGRRMADTTGELNHLAYGLYVDSQFTQIWGSGAGGTVVRNGQGTGVQQTLTVFGSIPGGQIVKPSSYKDTVTVTATF